ncbi:MAG: tetratricopeptide repeat protein [Candidatus Berkelbacteria bacterium]|nr:tetratricopeptide repeat protein [Candidatus Berkelbacteria bacterium]
MLEIAIIVCVAAVFVIIAVRFPKTASLTLGRREQKSFDDDAAILEAKKILNEKTPEELPEVLLAGTEPTDELDAYDEELSELLKSAREKIESGKYASAENILIDAICKNNKCAWAYERLGFIYLVMGKNLSDAAESFLMATKLDHDNDRAWFGLGQIYFSQSQFNKAIDAFSKAVNISRTDAEYQAFLGKAYMEVRQYGKASKALKRAASLDISNQEYKKLASVAEDKHREHSRASKLS